ncbi:cadherin-23-like [Mugil cephalus]|uniref:cadherin-23-like n=1 Tax=Mugil cephalus TaxID=48193 RepID=UPI001FB7643F|nr:cadherin-23-like [Mugil cephalus]
MDTSRWMRIALAFIVSVCVCVSDGSPVGTSVINCDADTNVNVGDVVEGYSGDVEMFTGIQATQGVKLVPNLFPHHLEFLELVFTLGDTNAIVRTKMPLDSDVLKNTSGTLYYSVMCDQEGNKINNKRTLKVNDINDMSPVFTQKLYEKTVSEAHPLDTEVLRVKAEDGDSSIEHSKITYSLEPDTEDFMLTDSGTFILKKPFNYNVAQKYNFTVTARDKSGWNDTATVVINVEDFDNMNPYFSHNLYQASVPENQIGGFTTILPEAIKAQDGDFGINETVIYSITAVSPDKYKSNFAIDPNSGVISVLTAFDREEISSNMISISIQAAQTDNSLKTAGSVVIITVEDMNDNPPVFDQTNYNIMLMENSPVGAVVLKATVADLDQGGFVGTLEIIPDTVPFSIGPDGTITVTNAAALDREAIESFPFQIKATENSPPNSFTTAQVTVTLLDVNDNSPVFTSTSYEGKVFANQTVGMQLVQVTAEDQDAGVNGEITYSIDAGNNEGYFSVDENTGVISLVKLIPLVENKILEFPLYVTARDGGTTSRSTTVPVNILAPGDSRPQFFQKVFQATVEEEQEPGAVILKVSFHSIDTEVDFTVETEADKFAISPTGELTPTVKLDYDNGPHNYSVQISISEDGVVSDNAVVEVQVIDVNDNSPVFTPSSFNQSVPEDAVKGFNVAVVTATDKDSGFNKEIRYFLIGGEGKFSIDSVSGMVSVAAALDRETKAEYNMLVVAEDQGRPVLNTTATLVVPVSDINDNVPKFSDAEYQIEVSETESVNTILFTLSAVDPDGGPNGRVSYSLVQQSPSSDPAVFELDSSSGTLQLVQPLDYSEVKVYTLTVQASDGGTPSLVGNSSVVVMVMDVNNNPPEFSKANYNVSILENLSSGASILTVEVTDRDEGGFVGTLEIIPETAPFSVDPDGTIRVTDATALDRETNETITFQVKATENSPPKNFTTAQVTLTLLDENDNSPTFTSTNHEGKVFANQTVGMQLVQVTAEDPDAGVNGEITYSIDAGNNEGYFSVDENTGVISLVKLIPLVENKILEFKLYITARDGGTTSRSTTVQVNILAPGDSRPQFLQKVFQATVEEEQEPGAVILKVSFHSIDTEVDFTVETEADKFAISPTGELTSTVKLDYDNGPHNYSVQISITDGVVSDNAVVEVQVIDVNDNSPVFTPSSFNQSVPENAVKGFNVTAVTATDKDSGFNKEIRYFLIGGEGRFSIDRVSGMVSVAAALDRETKAEYNMLVVAEDQGRPVSSATATLVVPVSDINDNVPSFSDAEYQIEVSETELVNTIFFTLSAVDPDEGPNGRVSYSIVQQSPSSDPAVFELDSSSGTLRLVQPLDYSEVKVYTLTVQASDGGTPSLVGTSSVVVTVMDVNNNPPEFSKANYDVSVSENLSSGASILTVEVTDRDEDGFSSGYFIYTSDTFDISKQGVVSLKQNVTLDRETKDSYVFQIVAVDQELDGLNATAQLNITVTDYNDNAPQFPSIPDTLTLPEGNYSEEAPGDVLTIVPTDPDLGANGEVVLSLLTLNPLFRFREDGMLLAVGPLDRESGETFDLVVKASDKGSPQRESFATIRVSLTDVNDNRPEFSSSTYASSILVTDAEEGKLLLTLSATDRDIGENAVISYSFSSGSSPYLALNSETGAVTLTSAISDVNEETTVELTAMAKDNGVPPLSSTAHVIVNLRIISEVETVAFQNSSYHFKLPENKPEGFVVGEVQASAGSGIYNIAYKLRTYGDLFSINSTGAITTRTALDKEQQEWYILDVEAVDTSNPSTSAVALVRVQVENVNEAPQFSPDVYKASVFSIAPANTPVAYVKALDPDVGDEAGLVYSVSDESHFKVDSSTGLVSVVSVADLAGQTTTVEVNATDHSGLQATAKLEVVVTEMTPESPDSDWKVPLLIALGVLLGLTLIALIVTGVLLCKFKKKWKPHKKPGKGNFDSEDYMFWSQDAAKPGNQANKDKGHENSVSSL